MGLHWDMPLMPYDWQNDREYADPVPEEPPPLDPIAELTAATLDLTYEVLKPGKASLR